MSLSSASSMAEQDCNYIGKRRQQQEEDHQQILISIIGSSHIKRYDLDLFPKGYKASTASYNAHITEFYTSQNIKFIINHKPKADIVVFFIGGNDIAFIGEWPPTDHQIIQAFIRTATQLHLNNFIVIIIPILTRTETHIGITRTSIKEYN